MDNKNTIQKSGIERRDAAENRQRILKAAIQLFAQFGVKQVSMNQIAMEAKVGPGTLYRRYRNKGELCLDLIKDHVVSLFEQIEIYLKENQTALPEERLKKIIGLFVVFREKKSQLLNGVEESIPIHATRSPYRNPLYEELHRITFHLFDEMFADKTSLPDNRFRADMLLMALQSDSYLFQREVRGYTPEEVIEQISALFIPSA